MKLIYATLLLISTVTAMSPSASAQSWRYNYNSYGYYGAYNGTYYGTSIKVLDAQGRGGHAI